MSDDKEEPTAEDPEVTDEASDDGEPDESRTAEAEAQDDPPEARSSKAVTAKAAGGQYTRRSVLYGLLAGLAVGGGAGFGAGYAVYGRRRARRRRKPMRPAYVPVAAHNPRKGPDPAKVTIIEFSEFQCPFCSRVLPTLDKIREKYPDDVAIVFKNNPLPFHKRAKPASAAFLAAARQGKAWEMHDLLFQNRKQLEDDDIEGYATKIGLDLEKFKADWTSPEIEAQIEADQKQAAEAGATGTPAFFINGYPLRGAKPYDDFVEVIDKELKRADELIAAGTALADVYQKRAAELVAKAGPAGKK